MIKKEVTRMTETNRNTVGKRRYIVTFGWPMGAVLYDYSRIFKQHLVKGGRVYEVNSQCSQRVGQ